MRSKLEKLGIYLPLLPLTSVGSFPKLANVLEARRRYPKNDSLRKTLEQTATRFWIKTQEELGYNVLVHGEMERGDMVAHFGEELEGMAPGNPQEPTRSLENLYWIQPKVCGCVLWKRATTVEVWKFSQSVTKLPMKGMITGPATIYDWSLDLFYGNRHRAVMDIAAVMRKEIEALLDAGAKIIQIDEPSLAHTPLDSFDTLREAFELMLEGLTGRAYFIMHTCYGKDIFEKLYPKLLEIPVDNLDLETANSGMKFLETIARYPVKKDITVGVADVHTSTIESVDIVRERIKAALQIIPKEKLWLGPDCGLKIRTVEQACQKLAVIAKARKEINIPR